MTKIVLVMFVLLQIVPAAFAEERASDSFTVTAFNEGLPTAQVEGEKIILKEKAGTIQYQIVPEQPETATVRCQDGVPILYLEKPGSRFRKYRVITSGEFCNKRFEIIPLPQQ